MEIIMRKAVLEDGNALFALVEKFATSFTPERSSFDECMNKLLNDDSVFLYVAEMNSKIAGYCLGFDHYAFYANGRVSWVEEIMVAEKLRQNGIGRQLMESFEEWARKRKSKLVGLATRRATSFYKALNYEESAAFFRKLL